MVQRLVHAAQQFGLVAVQELPLGGEVHQQALGGQRIVQRLDLVQRVAAEAELADAGAGEGGQADVRRVGRLPAAGLAVGGEHRVDVPAGAAQLGDDRRVDLGAVARGEHEVDGQVRQLLGDEVAEDVQAAEALAPRRTRATPSTPAPPACAAGRPIA